MSKARLVACPGCARHVRVSESNCVFCGVALPASFGAGPVLAPPPRLSRGGLYSYRARALAASTAALLTASCGATIEAGPSDDAGTDVFGSLDASPGNDGSPIVDASSPDAFTGDEIIATAYGLAFVDAGPPHEDASLGGDSGADSGSPDAAQEAEALDAAHDVGVIALYGSPPRDASSPDVVVAPPYGIAPAYGLSP